MQQNRKVGRYQLFYLEYVGIIVPLFVTKEAFL